MVGIVIVSHSATLAHGVAELARQMAGPDVVIAEAGGTDLPGDPLGTDAQLIMAAIERASSPDGVIVLMDLGSAVLSAELAVELLEGGDHGPVLLCEAPLVEGAVSAATAARLGRSLAEVAAEARAALQPKIAHLGTGEEAAPTAEPVAAAPAGPGRELRLVVKNAMGLHARPAARLVTALGRFDADIQLTNLTSGRGPASARSLNAVATIGARQGDEVLVTARGREADAALAEVQALADSDFGDTPPAGPVEADRRGPARPVAADGTLVGIAASPGVAIGAVRRGGRDGPDLGLAPQPVAAADPAAELRALDRALGEVRSELASARAEVARRAGDYEAAIFDVHRLLLDDDALLGPARAAIDGGADAAHAWDASVRAAVDAFAQLDDAYQRARADDVADVGRRVLSQLFGTGPAAARLSEPGILVAADLSPTDAGTIDPALLLGIATAGGGPLGHGAILARALGVPAVVGLGDAVMGLPEGTLVALDGTAGTLTLDPDPARVASAAPAPAPAPVPGETATAARGPVRTGDGHEIALAANAASAGDAEKAVAQGAEGIGLLRTEFLFLGRPDLPGEEEQVEAYRRVAVALAGRPLVIRTLDAGSDKPLAGLSTGASAGEENPALGVRGLRLGLTHPDVLTTQLRAVLRVAADHPVQVMFPMVTTVDEVRRAKALLAEARRALVDEGRPVPERLPVGIMVEVPAAALAAGQLASEVDFFSIGTNDLTQYAMAADRTNPGLAELADGLHPAVLRLIDHVVRAAAPGRQWVGVCGELAADPAAVPVLVGLGVTELSVRPSALAQTRAAIEAAETHTAKALAQAALGAPSAAAVRRLVQEGLAAPERASRLLTRITWARVALVPIVVALVLAGDTVRHAYVVGACVFVAAALTDLVDGYLARRWAQTSEFGSFLDTTADKILVTGALVALVSAGRASPWWATLIVFRELAVLGLRGLVAADGGAVRPSASGKHKADVQIVALTLAMVRVSWRWGPWHPDEWAMAAAAVLAVTSGVAYFRRFRSFLVSAAAISVPGRSR